MSSQTPWSNSLSGGQQPMGFRFLDLPGEIRNGIYSLMLRASPSTQPLKLKVRHEDFHAILLVNRQIRKEALPLYYALNRFFVKVFNATRELAHFMQPPYTSSIRWLMLEGGWPESLVPPQQGVMVIMNKEDEVWQLRVQFWLPWDVDIGNFFGQEWVQCLKPCLRNVVTNSTETGILDVDQVAQVMDFVQHWACAGDIIFEKEQAEALAQPEQSKHFTIRTGTYWNLTRGYCGFCFRFTPKPY